MSENKFRSEFTIFFNAKLLNPFFRFLCFSRKLRTKYSDCTYHFYGFFPQKYIKYFGEILK